MKSYSVFHHHEFGNLDLYNAEDSVGGKF